ncbi:UDP-N-acetylmuramoyl-L-alanyl-D-glutamate--2,6-diaminopimelate ligase [bacterium]|nr:UDP-N-acetylmuramoyl-L-alanyl-D-glutamate--2,6-diaminopimelate ligase [bacterium]
MNFKRPYHYLMACLAPILYGHPSEKMVVIGVTGTNGKSTTVEYIGRILEHAGHRVGWTSTASFKVGEREWANDKKMTMLGRFQTQRLLRDMVKARCEYAIVETSSQGIEQFRHVGINYDVAAFTNLTPEHIESHGGFENYKKAKGKLFTHLANGSKKNGREKVAVVNLDDEHAGYFLSFGAAKNYGFGLSSPTSVPPVPFVSIVAANLSLSATGSTFDIQDSAFRLPPIGRFNVYNCLAAISVCRAVGLSWKEIQDGVARLAGVPGRLESIDESQPFSVIVDYAPEPYALTALYEALALIEHGRVIHVLGSTGGGRDVARRRILGELAAERDDVVIVSNEDPYDDDPMEIIRQVADGARAKKTEGENLFLILDRQEAIRRAISMARPGDLVLLTGKGCEPVMAVAHGKKIPWDDRAAARRSLHELGYGAHR